MTRTKIQEGGHSGPLLGELENSSSVTHETELGRLPADWRVVPLREAYSFTKKPRGLTIPLDGTIPFLPMDAIPIGRVSVSAFEERPSSKLTSGIYIENGDLLVAKITPSFENGKQAIVKWDRPFGFATTEVIPIQEIKGISDKHYLFHILLHPEIRADLAGKMDGTTGRQRLSKEVLGAKQIPLPPLAEQRKIAGVLVLVQRAIEQQERLIAVTTELKKTLLHQLFTQGLRGEPQKQTEIGLVPESWEVVKLEDAAVTFDYGTSVKCEHGKAGVPVLRIPNVVVGSIDLSDLKHGQPKRSELEQLRLRDGDLLFVRTNGVLENAGRCALYRGELEGCYFASYLIRVRVNSSKVLPAFVNEYARTERGKSFLSGRAIRTADGKFNINSGTLKRVLLPLPSLDEQKEIICQLDLVERKLKLHKAKHSVLNDLFRTLLHQLMAAQLRVHNLELCIEDLTMPVYHRLED
jgi:type I restriction enzyme S subunit